MAAGRGRIILDEAGAPRFATGAGDGRDARRQPKNQERAGRKSGRG